MRRGVIAGGLAMYIVLVASYVIFAKPESVRTVTVHRPPNLGVPGPEARGSATGCGVERWSIKTLTDPGANQVNLTPVEGTIAALAAIPAPVGPTDRVAPVDTTTYRISGTLIFTAKEADGDYHLAIEDAAGKTMIAEIPNPTCAAGSVVLGQITEARKEFEAKFGVPSQYPAPALKPNTPVTLTGVGFFDKLHGQTGVAPNGIEMHPVLSVQFTTGLTAPAAPVPPLHLVIGEAHGSD
jgi:hypothetical protein